MKLPHNNHYFKISCYAVASAIVLSAAVIIMVNMGSIYMHIFRVISIFLNIISPVIWGIVIAFILDPVVEFYEERIGSSTKYQFKKRIRGTLAAFITVIILITALITAVYKSLGAADITGISEEINKLINDFSGYINSLQQNLSQMGVLSLLNGVLNSVMDYGAALMKKTALSAAGSISSIGGEVIKIGIGIALSFYFLSEKERMLYRLNDMVYVFFPEKYASKLMTFFSDLNFVFSGYVSGQITDALVMAALFSVSFWAAGIKYAFVIGVISGLFNIIPYIGAVAAFILSVFVALVSGTPSRAIYAAIVVITIQQIDGFIISPKIVGQSVKLHPVFVVVSLFIFGSLWGFSGMIVAVPLMAVIKINFDRFYEKKRRNKLKPLT